MSCTMTDLRPFLFRKLYATFYVASSLARCCKVVVKAPLNNKLQQVRIRLNKRSRRRSRYAAGES
jgi:hypothetical protein